MKRRAPRKPPELNTGERKAYIAKDFDGIFIEDFDGSTILVLDKECVALRNWLTRFIEWAEYRRKRDD